jgi:thymidylate synthase ThyX
MPEQFTPDETGILSKFFTNMDKPVFCLINLPEVVKGALFSRYSRSANSLRRVLLNEFIQAPEMGFSDIVGPHSGGSSNQLVAVQKAEEFYDRILVGYGDDSVAELGLAHIACEDVSLLSTKTLEHGRIGLSPLEKSTRYVRFDKRDEQGNYKFLREPTLMSSGFADLYLEVNNLLFDTYSKLLDKVLKWVKENNPQGETSDRAYESACRAKACDTVRGLLPASTLTNLGISGNGRAFEYMLTKMYANPLAEIRDIAASMHTELAKVLPSFVKRANNEHGRATQAFYSETEEALKKLAKQFLSTEAAESSDLITLVKYDPEAEAKAVATALYPHCHLPMSRLMRIASRMNESEKKTVIDEYCKRRQNRRHKPGRAFENVSYTFDILANFGVYRDLQRHRMLTQERQLLTVKHGYDTPKEISEIGLEAEFREAMNAAADAYWRIASQFPHEAQYVVPNAYRLRWYFTLSLREVYFLTELRSMQQGHPDYRRVAQQMYQKVREVHPSLAAHMRFVDMNDYSLERIESERQLDKKLAQLKDKYGLAKSA